jgi:N-hydroxyarylamine O-acetyltransferase
MARVIDVEGYLRRLGVSHPGPPTVGKLVALHRAHVERVPYETMEIQLGRPTTVDPSASAARIVSGAGGGYCFHLNGAFALLLDALGYRVRRHVGGVFRDVENAPGADGNHAALTVELDGEWFVDVGLGDALHEPMPLRAGEMTQGPFTYRLERSPLVPGGWRFWHAANAESFTGMDFGMEPAEMADFAPHHERLSTSPDSGFVATITVARRYPAGLSVLRGCGLREIGASGRTDRILDTADEWFATVRDRFGMPLDDLDDDARTRFFDRLWAGHQAFHARPSPR